MSAKLDIATVLINIIVVRARKERQMLLLAERGLSEWVKMGDPRTCAFPNVVYWFLFGNVLIHYKTLALHTDTHTLNSSVCIHTISSSWLLGWNNHNAFLSSLFFHNALPNSFTQSFFKKHTGHRIHFIWVRVQFCSGQASYKQKTRAIKANKCQSIF